MTPSLILICTILRVARHRRPEGGQAEAFAPLAFQKHVLN